MGGLGKNAVTGLITVSVGFGVALAILILTCAFTNNWIPLSSLVVYVLIPAPMVLVGIKGSDGEMNLWVQFGYCMGGFILSCLFGLPTIGAHLGWINDSDGDVNPWILSMWIVANLIMLISITGFAMISGAKA